MRREQRERDEVVTYLILLRFVMTIQNKFWGAVYNEVIHVLTMN